MSNIARSRTRCSRSSQNRMAQTCFGLSACLAPSLQPAFHGLRWVRHCRAACQDQRPLCREAALWSETPLLRMPMRRRSCRCRSRSGCRSIPRPAGIRALSRRADDVCHPQLIGSVRGHLGRQNGEDRLVVVAVCCSDVAPSLLRRQAMLAHEPSHPLAVHELASVAQLGGDPTIAGGWPSQRDSLQS